jgi:hypothetical protein
VLVQVPTPPFVGAVAALHDIRAAPSSAAVQVDTSNVPVTAVLPEFSAPSRYLVAESSNTTFSQTESVKSAKSQREVATALALISTTAALML